MGLLVRHAALLAVVCIASAAAWNALIRTSKIDPGHVHLLPPRPMEGIYAHNEKLSMAEPLGWGLIPSPEDLALDKDKKSFFTGCGDGWIKRVWIDRPGGEHVENWTFVGGRPLGVALGPSEELIVCEVEKGLLNVTEDKVEVLCSEADGSKFKMVDGVDVTKEGVIYFTDATNKFTLAELE